MSSNPIPASTPSGGSSYKYCVGLYLTAENLEVKQYEMTNENMLDQLGILLNGDLSEKITEVLYYKNPLVWCQFSNSYLYHAFVVLKTTNCWWSMEKNSEEVVFQRSEKLDDVRDQSANTKRSKGLLRMLCSKVKKQAIARSDLTLNTVVTYIREQNLVNIPYNLKDHNCQHFADFIYAYVSGQHV
uniref:Uncharacterized protein n=1 Tax=Daphnia galeata TaxID=27404 RepID=A0A8J2WQ56_9CRUS|nr:unnamed protein product [Daphnia galeata]